MTPPRSLISSLLRVGVCRKLCFGFLILSLAGCTGVPLPPPVPPAARQSATGQTAAAVPNATPAATLTAPIATEANPPAAAAPATTRLATPATMPETSATPPQAAAQTAPPDPTRPATPTGGPTAVPTLATAAAWVAYGEARRLASKFDVAEVAFSNALGLDAKNAAAHTGLSKLYAVQLGKRKAALEHAEQAVALAPNDAAAWTVLAEAQLWSSAAEALASAQKAVALDDSASTEAALADALRMDYRYDEAQTAVERALTLDPQSAEAYVALAALNRDRRDLNRALAAAQRAAELLPDYAPYLSLIGDLQSARGDHEAALRTYDRALKISPKYDFVAIGKAFARAALGTPDAGITLLTALKGAYPDAIEPRLALASLVLDSEGGAAAVSRYQEALRIDSEDQDGRMGLAQSWVTMGDCQHAATEYRSLTQKYPRAAGAWGGLSSALLCLEDIPGAVQAARKATELDPYDGVAQLVLGLALYSDDQLDAATDAFMLALALEPSGTEHAMFGQDFANAGSLEQAEVEYKLAREHWNEYVWSAFSLCDLYLNQGRVKDAVGMCQEGYDLDRSSPGWVAEYAWALLLDDQPEAALEILTSPDVADDAQKWLLLGVTQYQRRLYPLGAEAFSRFMARNPGDEPSLAQLVDDLRAGYEIDPEAALALAGRLIPAAIGRPVTVSRGENTEGAYLTVDLVGQPGEVSRNLVSAALVALGTMQHVVPRVVGQASGAEVRASTAEGEPVFAAYASKDVLRQLLIGLIDVGQFLERIEYKPVLRENTPAGWDEALIRGLGSKAAQVRELPQVQPVAFRAINGEQIGEGLDAQTVEDLEAVRKEQAVLTLLGLLEPGADLQAALKDFTASSVLGYYDSAQKVFVYRADETPNVIQELTIVHEYVHALQDQHFTLGATPSAKIDDDRRLAYRALVEGDAALAQFRYVEEMLGAGDALASSAESDRLGQQSLKMAPPAVVETLRFPYEQGVEFVSRLYEAGGWKAVNNAFVVPPSSTEQVLHYDKYLAREEPLTVAAPKLPASLEGDWKVADRNVMGEFGWRQVIAARTGPMSGILGGMGWGGDRYTLFQQGSGPAYMLAATVEWDTEGDAQEFVRLYTAGMRMVTEAEETTADLLSAEPLRTWLNAGMHSALKRVGKKVHLVVGPQEPAVQALIQSLN